MAFLTRRRIEPGVQRVSQGLALPGIQRFKTAADIFEEPSFIPGPVWSHKLVSVRVAVHAVNHDVRTQQLQAPHGSPGT